MFDDMLRFAWAWANDAQGPEDPFAPPFGEARGPRSPFDGPRPHFRNFWGMFGPGGRARGPNMYGRGDLKFVLLDLLQEQPKHGYEMIKDLENRAGGFYTPSAGAVYPTLQLLEDRGWVTSAMVDGKKVYTITDEGKAALQERHAQQQEPRPGPDGPPPGFGRHGHHGPRGPFGRHITPDLEALGRETFEVARLMRDAVMSSQGDPAKLAEIRKIVEQTRTALQAFVQGGISGTGGSETPPAPPPDMV